MDKELLSLAESAMQRHEKDMQVFRAAVFCYVSPGATSHTECLLIWLWADCSRFLIIVLVANTMNSLAPYAFCPLCEVCQRADLITL